MDVGNEGKSVGPGPRANFIFAAFPPRFCDISAARPRQPFIPASSAPFHLLTWMPNGTPNPTTPMVCAESAGVVTAVHPASAAPATPIMAATAALIASLTKATSLFLVLLFICCSFVCVYWRRTRGHSAASSPPPCIGVGNAVAANFLQKIFSHASLKRETKPASTRHLCLRRGRVAFYPYYTVTPGCGFRHPHRRVHAGKRGSDPSVYARSKGVKV